MLIVNADDLGRTKEITDSILICYSRKRIDSASAMTFMKDSKRASDLAQESNLPVGLHLNFSLEFTGAKVSAILRDKQKILVSYLKSRKFHQILYNPMLEKTFDYVFQAQWDEYCRLYGEEPNRLDGHHHMHLCMNMLFLNKYPKGIDIRRNFTFSPGEKNPINLLYRRIVDKWLISRFKCKDYFFSISPIEGKKIKKIMLLSKSANVELMVHPGVVMEYNYLLSEEWVRMLDLTRDSCYFVENLG